VLKKIFADRIKKSLEFKILAVVTTILTAGIIIAAFMSISVQKATLYGITEFSSDKTAEIILRNIETTMLEGRKDIAKKVIDSIAKTGGVDAIAVYDSDGREAFKEGSAIVEAAAIGKLRAGQDRIRNRERARFTYYLPLKNSRTCSAAGCHSQEKPLLGAVKVSMTIEQEYKKAMNLISIVIFVTFFASIGFSLLLWFMLRKMVIKPVKSIETAVSRIAQGDLTFTIEASGKDEVGNVITLLSDSFHALESVLLRIRDLSDRMLRVVEEVEQVAEKMVQGAEEEADATENIASAVEELNATTSVIAGNTDDLATSAGDASASVEELVSSIRNINESIRELDEVAESSSVSIVQLSEAIKEVASSSVMLSEASDQTAASISEIAAAIREVESHAKESAALSEKVAVEAGTLGMAAVAKTVEGMKEIEQSVRNTGECITTLEGRSREIEKIVNVIKSVNDETNLLSLNAAILASQAGERGRGFAVVASEMKDLSERTGHYTKDISSLIKAVQSEVSNAEQAMQKGIRVVEEGLKLAYETEDALRKVLDSSKQSSEMTMSIKRSTMEQSKAAGQVMDASERVRTMTEHIASATSEQSKGATLIAEAAERLKSLSYEVSRATAEQASSSALIGKSTELVSEKSRKISLSLGEQKKGAGSILASIEAVRDVPKENRDLAFRLRTTLANLQKDAALLKAEMERFKLSTVQRKSLRLGVAPLQEPAVMFKKFTPLAEYLSRKLGRRVELKVAIDMQGAIRDVGENTTQICAMGPTHYVGAASTYGVKPIVRAMRLGKPFHRAAIVVRADSRLQSLKDLKGGTLALSGRNSATGHIMPLAALRDAGVAPADLKSFDFIGSHVKIALAVLEGKFDAGGMSEEAAEQHTEKGLKILGLSVGIPEFGICCNPQVDETTVEALRAALTSLDVERPDQAVVLRSLGKDCTGFISATEGDYDELRRQILGL